MDWKLLEDAFVLEAEKAFTRWVKRNPGHLSSAMAFNECHRMVDDDIRFPSLALQSIHQITNDSSLGDLAWTPNSADWQWLNILPERSPLKKHESIVNAYARRGSQAQWLQTEKRLIATLIRASRRLYRLLKDHTQTTNEFVVFFDDEGGDLEIIKRCLPVRLYTKYFQEFEPPSVCPEASEAEKVKQYFENMILFDNQILALGADAIDPLILKLTDEDDQMMAARLLGSLGIRDQRVIRSLRKHTRQHSGMAEFSSMALFELGDLDYLLHLAKLAETRTHAVMGILKCVSGNNDLFRSIPLDYRPVECLLNMKKAAITREVNRQIPVTGQFASSDVDEAIRGLSSAYAVIRRHAVSTLADRGLRPKEAKRILPLIAEHLHDPDPNVRRSTLLSLSLWKSAAEPYRAMMKALQKDKDPEVRSFARYILQYLFKQT